MWGRFVERADSREEAWARISESWSETKTHKLEALREQEESKAAVAEVLREDKTLRQGVIHTLGVGECGGPFKGMLWGEGRRWELKDQTGVTVEADVPDSVPLEDVDAHRDRLLFAKLRARQLAAAKQHRSSEFRQTQHECMPQSVGDLTIKGTHAGGSLVYVWQGVQVIATPRNKRDASGVGESYWGDSHLDELTPDRALRKMCRKFKRQMDRAAKGAKCPIVVTRRDPPDSTTAEGVENCSASSSAVPALRSLNDPLLLGHLRNAYEFLASARLLHCGSCDEEWVVFDVGWPQAGVPFAGAKAGRCETISRRGFEASWKHAGCCSRCASAGVYRAMYSEANLQHLGERRPALSNLTWYESLLVARVHPVMSVITLTATGLLCYAGHVCRTQTTSTGQQEHSQQGRQDRLPAGEEIGS